MRYSIILQTRLTRLLKSKAVFLTLFLASCAQTVPLPRNTVTDLPTISSFELIASDLATDIEGPDARIVNVPEGSGVLVGAVGGAAAASTCAATLWLGPGVCIVGYILAGTTAGAAFDFANDTGLSDSDFLYVTAAIGRATKDRDLQQEIIEALDAQLSSVVSAVSDGLHVKVIPQFAYVDLSKPRGDNLQVDIVGWLRFTWGLNDRYTVEFRSRSEEAGISSWIAEGGSKFSDAISAGLEAVSIDMANYLEEQLEGDGTGNLE